MSHRVVYRSIEVTEDFAASSRRPETLLKNRKHNKAKSKPITRKADALPTNVQDLQEMIETDNVVFAEFIVEGEENVFPMIPPAAGVKQMMTDPTGGLA